MKLFWTVFQMYGVSKCMFRVLIVKLLLLKNVNMIKPMGISETVVEISYIKTTQSDPNHACHSRKMREVATQSKSSSNISGHVRKCKQRYVDCFSDQLKLTFLIHGHGHSS